MKALIAYGLISFFLVLLSCNKFTAWLKLWQTSGQPIRSDGPQSHVAKAGTVTMGGILILAISLIIMFLYAGSTSQLYNSKFLCIISILLIYGCLGLLDDYLKVVHKNPKGLSGKTKLTVQLLSSIVVSYMLSNTQRPAELQNVISLFGMHNLHIGLLYPIFGSIVITGTSNAVNLTDGLDGLVSGVFSIVALTLAFMVCKSDELVAGLLIILVGATLGFLWFNCKPAQLFMGDVGSLSLGGALGTASVAAMHEMMLLIIASVFVIEACSVIIQVASFKIRKKRVFLMAPIHHHFEQLGISEQKIVVRFWIVTLASCVFALLFYI